MIEQVFFLTTLTLQTQYVVVLELHVRSLSAGRCMDAHHTLDFFFPDATGCDQLKEHLLCHQAFDWSEV